MSQVAMSVDSFREQVAEEITKQASASQSLSGVEKNKIARVMGGHGWFNRRRRERVIDAAVHQLHAEQMIDVTPDGVEAAIDWDGIASFLERLMPLILTFIKLFGG